MGAVLLKVACDLYRYCGLPFDPKGSDANCHQWDFIRTHKLQAKHCFGERIRTDDTSAQKRHQSGRKTSPANSLAMKRLAWQATALGMRAGIIPIQQHCDECGSDKPLVGHHDDYAKPYDVRMLCRSCHGKWHARNDAGCL